ncbi:pilus assembly protein [Altererythrobacter aurantiacus]|uniref:Pilus assembly protein n=1 Tax=Parapontixanthobacter aurantiacus TaxID=1463599 RepID=A0A844ZED7_9SPHN|nr:TadE/TadG family type IV pilus assembly protein [Parapontixanthobacter aurantiacus]MXO85623.1 pilus assembly protein [Parapontixanthobacter aurantiacus]
MPYPFRPFADLQRDERGVAITEFSLALPALLILILGGLEVSNLALTHLRVSQIAMTVADNAGRVRSTIDEADVYEVFAGADLMGRKLDFAERGRVVLSSVEDNGRSGANRGQYIRWQRCFGAKEVDPAYGVEGDGRDDASLADGLGRPEKRIAASRDTAVMFVEASYTYEPLLIPDGFGSSTVRYETAFNVRERDNFAITNTQALTENACD